VAVHTVWHRAPATRYQPGRSSAAARASTPVSVPLRVTAARKGAELLVDRQLAGQRERADAGTSCAGGAAAAGRTVEHRKNRPPL